MAGRRRIERKTTRTGLDPVTGKYVTVDIDAVFVAKEAIMRAVDQQMLKLSAANDRYRVVSELREELKALLPHEGGELVEFGSAESHGGA